MTEEQSPKDSPATPVKEAAAEVQEAVAEKAEQVARASGERVRSALDQQKERAAGELETVARAFRSAATDLEHAEHASSASVVSKAAHAAERLSRRLREKDARELVEEAAQFARHHPFAIAAGGLLAGAILGRLVGLGRGIASSNDASDAA